jgi:hypothetical protein
MGVSGLVARTLVLALAIGTASTLAHAATSGSVQAPSGAAGSATAADSGAPDEAAYKAAYQQAQTLAQQSLDEHAGWTTTGDTLKQAQKAAASGDYRRATALAGHAAALARLSIEQAKEQETAWKAAVVR